MKFKTYDAPLGEFRVRSCFLFYPRISLPDKNGYRETRWLEYATFKEAINPDGLWVTHEFIDNETSNLQD